MSKNIFAQIGADDSDDEYEAKPMTKTQKKKEEKKVVEKEVQQQTKAVKINEAKMAEGGFEVTGKPQSRASHRLHSARGGGDRGGRGRGERGGRGRGGPRTNEQGDTVFDADKKTGGRF